MCPAASAAALAAAGVVQIGEDDDDLAHGRYRTAIVKLTLESAPGGNLIRGYSQTEIRIGEQRVHVSCIVTASELFDRLGSGDLRRVQQRTPAGPHRAGA